MIGTYARSPVEFVRGEGLRLWDAEGNEYLDFLGGISVVQIGHCASGMGRGRVGAGGASRACREPLLHGAAMRLAERLSERSLGGKVFFTNSGAEAIECAIKLARRHKHRAARGRCSGGRLPRKHVRRAVGDPAGVEAGAVRAARPGFAVVPRERSGRGRLGGVGGDRCRYHRADPGRERYSPDSEEVPAVRT